MAEPKLESSALSAFCNSVATMLSAGIQTDEAVGMLGENMEDATFKRVCDRVYSELITGCGLAAAMEASGAFPRHAINMTAAGERSGRLENVMRSLAVYYDEEARLFDKIRASVGYPAALLCVMTVILAFTVIVILPVFVNVYENLSGTLTAGSFSAVNASIIIGWIALIITLVLSILAVAAALLGRTESGRQRLLALLARLPMTRDAIYQLALSRFASAVATFIASGVNTDDAVKEALAMVEHPQLRAKVESVYNAMINLDSPKSLAQAVGDERLFEPVYARMLTIGARSGSTDEVLAHLSSVFFDDAVGQIDRAIDGIEPALAAFLTVAVGATLIAVMLPLIGIMGSIG